MSYSYSTDGGSSDIELVTQAPAPVVSTSSSRLHINSNGGPSTTASDVAYNSNSVNNIHDNHAHKQDYGDFFAEYPVLQQPLPGSSQPTARTDHQYNTQPSHSRQETRPLNTDKSDVIEIGDSDEDDNEGPSSDRGLPSLVPRPSSELRKTHSAPSAVFGDSSTSKSKGKQRLFEPIESDEDDDDDDADLPALSSIAARANILKRSNSDSLASTSTSTKRRFKYTDSNNPDKSRRALSPIPASSPPPAGYSERDPHSSTIASRDHNRANKSGGFHLPSDLDSSDDGEEKPKKKRQPPIRQTDVSTHAGSEAAEPSKVKPPTKTQLLAEERAAKKAQKEKEKAEKAVRLISWIFLCSADTRPLQEELANLKERKNGLKIANKLEDRQEHCKEIIIDISAPLFADPAFRDKVWIDLKARFAHVYAKHSVPAARPGCHSRVVSWRRTVTKDYVPDLRYWVPRPEGKFTIEQEKTVLLFLTGQEVEKAVAAYKFPDDADKGDTLLEMVAKVRKVYGQDYQVFLLVHGLSLKLKAKKSAENAAFQDEVHANSVPNNTKRKKASTWDDRVNQEDIEQELVRLQLIARCSIQRTEKYDDVVDWIAEFTKDVAHRPYK